MRSSPSSSSPISRRTRRFFRRKAGPSRNCTSFSVDWSAAVRTTRRPIRTARSVRVSSSRSARSPQEARPRRFSTRCRTPSATCSSREDFLALRQESPEFERYCTQAITETLRQSLESLYSQYRERAAEQQSLTRTLAELVRNPPVACPVTATLREAAQQMADAKVRTIIVQDGNGVPVGMVTLVDLLQRVLLPERPLAEPVASVMSTPIVTLVGSATAYEALHVMAEHGIRQIIVVENGRLARRHQRARPVRTAAGVDAAT